MKIEFCLAESGEIIFTKKSRDLKDIIEVITRVGTEVNLTFSKDDFIHGYVQNILYQANAEENDESIRIYISNDCKNFKNTARISAEHLSSTKLKS
ncbi:hypothetical protein FDA33_15415 [Clostridium botulinum]|nr:hypothetical protein [Clostridium botulinum]NFI17533.1 hypothetical protein [Clostridium botulinum]NFL94441.1 hypothetical protein [Clostridium botulinum]NFN53190.1 hypothetical protein [Clostridium botulinum]NFO27847.1 hypothetical protein [Clostridium botulinum]